MAGLKSTHWIAVGLTLALIVLLLFAPHHSGNVKESTASAQLPPVPDVEYRIDSALSIISGPAPMQGILLLREVAEENPGNFRAQYHLGRFSAQTAQWEKVMERFEMVKKIDPEFAEADYWIGLAHFQMGDAEKAVVSLESFISRAENSDELLQEAQTMLNQLK